MSDAGPGPPGPAPDTARPGAPAERRGVVVLLAAVAVLVAAVGAVVAVRAAEGDEPAAAATNEAPVVTGFPRDVTAYEGLGAWIDVFDYAPAYAPDGIPVLTPADVPALAAHGVRTLYLQAARLDDRTPGGLVDPPLVGAFVEAAHAEGLRVVAWYLPKFSDLDADLLRLQLLHAFRHGEHRFDGLAVDIEFTEGVADPVERSRRLVELSQRARTLVGAEALGAIVLPPVLTEVVNPAFWPGLPWGELAGLYDVWLPMAYWTDRRADSGYRHGATYVEESVRRLRANLGRPDALVHPVGGIGDALTEDQLRDYLGALVATRAIGGSIYDARTTSSGGWAILRAGVPAATAPAVLAGAGAAPTGPAS